MSGLAGLDVYSNSASEKILVTEDPFGVCLGSVRGSVGVRSGSVRSLFGIRSGSVRDPFGVRSASVQGPFRVRSDPETKNANVLLQPIFREKLSFWKLSIGPA